MKNTSRSFNRNTGKGNPKCGVENREDDMMRGGKGGGTCIRKYNTVQYMCTYRNNYRYALGVAQKTVAEQCTVPGMANRYARRKIIARNLGRTQ